MKSNLQQRLVLALIGAAAGASLYTLGEILDGNLLGERLALALAVFTTAFFFGLLAMAGPLRTGRAAILAAGVGLVAAALLSWAGLRFDSIGGLIGAGHEVPRLGRLQQQHRHHRTPESHDRPGRHALAGVSQISDGTTCWMVLRTPNYSPLSSSRQFRALGSLVRIR